MIDPRTENIIQLLVAYAKGDLEKRIVVDDEDDEINAIGHGLNMLGEELSYSNTQLAISRKETQKLLSDLIKRNNDLVQFTNIVSHDLRGRVATILGLSTIANSSDFSDSEKSEHLKYIHDTAIKLANLIEDLSSLLDARAHAYENKTNVCLAKVMNVVSMTLGDQIAEAKAQIETMFPDDASELFSNKAYLQSILYNLTSNAIKYKSPERKPEIIISSKREDARIIVTVSDNGMGIDLQKHKDKIFGLYQRFNKEVEGKGLGLHMVKTQVEALGGKIELESSLGVGTTFTLILPAN